MAITKIWTVKSRLDTSLKYIANPEKTNLKPDMSTVDCEECYLLALTAKSILHWRGIFATLI